MRAVSEGSCLSRAGAKIRSGMEVLSNVIMSVLDVVASQPSSAATNITADGASAAAPDKDGT
eukprot:COSAG01_NODE_283_length_19477_cov_44.267468_18_plen_62_part_00